MKKQHLYRTRFQAVVEVLVPADSEEEAKEVALRCLDECVVSNIYMINTKTYEIDKTSNTVIVND